jgi:ceramide glucosyltransferase
MWVAWSVLGVYFLIHIASSIAFVVRLRKREPTATPPGNPLVSLIRPLRGLENHLEAALRSSFALTYRNLEILFCVEEEDDPVVPLIRRLIAEHPAVNARLLVGIDRTGGNPKVDNLAKGWRASTGEWIIFSDSNVLLEPNFVEALFGTWQPGVGLVSTPVVIREPETFAAELEAAFVNNFVTFFLLLGDTLGLCFAFGKTLMWPREVLARGGGITTLTSEAADEISASKTVRYRLRMKQRHRQRPVSQRIGRRDFVTVWRRIVRWHRLFRSGYPTLAVAEFFVLSLPPLLVAFAMAFGGAMSFWGLAVFLVAWYGVEALRTVGARLAFSPTMPIAWFIRDVFIVPVTWVLAWTGSTIEWRGAKISAARPPSSPDTPEPSRGAPAGNPRREAGS